MARILVVDDEPDVRDLCATALREAGHQVVLADNGQLALEVHRLKPQDVVVVDMFMPIKDGLATITELRQARTAPKIIAVSAGWRVTARRESTEGRGDILDHAGASGADMVLRKPFDPEELVRAVSEVLGKPGT
jgi:two-component system chemotaxis response regulator CheY